MRNIISGKIVRRRQDSRTEFELLCKISLQRHPKIARGWYNHQKRDIEAHS